MLKVNNVYIKKLLIFFLIVTGSLLCAPPGYCGNSKQDSTSYKISGKYHFGIVVPHHTSMTYLIEDYSKGFEINLLRRRFSSGIWESYMNRPEAGIGFWYSTFGQKEIYGEGFAIYPFINFRIFEYRSFIAQYRVALGLGYANNPFDVRKNTYNTVFGSHFNAYVGFGLLLAMPVTENWSINSSISLNHMSNGSARKPNNGINTATLTLGASYNLTSFREPAMAKAKAPHSGAREILTTGSAGRNQSAAYNPQIHWSGSITLTHLWYTKVNKAYGLGLDFIHFGGAPLAFGNFEDLSYDAEYSFSDNLYSGVFGTMESHLGTTALYIATGVYLMHNTKPRQPVYARLGVRQKIHKGLLAHFGIKANFFTAEFIEFGLGYRWRYRS
jgi:hypothetical protein